MKKCILLSIFTLLLGVTAAQQKFNSMNNESLVAYEVPEWYQDAKLGYWAIWGLYSIPAYAGDHAAEWYGRWMYCEDDGAEAGFNIRGLKTANYHRKKFGDPAEFGYKDFVPMFTAKKFDADEWLDFCVDGGAKFFTMMGIFCDNYCMWDSESNPFNTMDTTPNRDFVAELKEATNSRGLHFGLSNHSSWNGIFFEYNDVNFGDTNSPDTDWIYGTGSVDAAAVDRWWQQTIEMADKYHPDLFYFDWCWNSSIFDQKRPQFLEHYYNEALKWNNSKYPSPEVVVNYKKLSTLPYGSAVLDLERGGMSNIEPEVWQNDTSIGITSWSYVPGEKYRSSNQIIDMLMDIISKNGVLMLAFGPKADGSIPSYANKTIINVGKWLKINGESVYATRPWCVYGEGPTTPKKGMGGDEVEYVAEDVRFTRSKDNTTLYVTFLGYPEDGEGVVKILRKENIDLKDMVSIELLGVDSKVYMNQKDDGLHIKLPKSTPKNSYAYSIKLKFMSSIPQLK